uniref:Histone-lysine N-methyltransferase eggless n=1 Tax=Cacopsylla melanoneura TaxID=428564 RepID=A0A8D9ENV0_9HEMI
MDVTEDTEVEVIDDNPSGPSDKVDGKDKAEGGQKERKSHCLNAACKSAMNLILAESIDFVYYDVKKSNINYSVCVPCHEAVEAHFEEVINKFNKDEPITDIKFPSRTDIVCIDSDEEIDLSSNSDDEGAPFDQETLDLINTELNDILAKNFPKDRVDKQANQFITQLTKEAEDFAKELKEQRDQLHKNQIQLDKIHNAFHALYAPEIKHLPPLDIESDDDQPNSQPVIEEIPDSQVTDHHVEYRNQQLQQHQTLLQRQLLSNNNTTLTPTRQSVATITPVPASPPVRNIADDMIVEERRSISSRPLNLPRLAPQGVSPYKPPINKDTVLWAMKKNNMSSWGKCIVEEVITTLDENKKTTKRYKVKLLPEKKIKVLSGNALAFTTPNEYLFRVGMRVISIFASKDYYSGTVAEIPKETNKWRYLIFFDDGYTSYSYHEDILMICEPSEKTQDDVPLVLRNFIREYLQKYPERAMVKLSVGEKMATQYKNKWVNAKVLEVDCSLARMCFGSPNECDWIFRGSDRLRPLYETKVNAARRNMIENMRRSKQANTKEGGAPNYMVSLTRPKVQTARKSLSGKNRPQVYFETLDKKQVWTPVRVPGRCQYKKVEGVEIVQCKKFIPHTCNKMCVSWIRWNFDSLIKKVNMLAIPLYTGFRRKMMTFQSNKKCIMYTAPCGRNLRSSEQMVLYLFSTKSKWTIDMFEFDHFVDCLREFVIDNANITIKDMSGGRENVPISCVNYINTEVPKTVDYMTERKPKDGVIINTNSEFMVCCDCTDDCRNRDECACWQLTINGSRDLSATEPKDFVGYQNRRLPEHLVSGIFECNERCKCKQSCHNRVVQFPMLQKLQLFKTEMKGWGLRCLNDIPQGTFICIYAGHLLTDSDANEEGKNYGDEYLAELDFIETVERYKEAYESDVPEEDMIEEENNENNSDDDDDSPGSNEENSQDKDLQAILNSDDETESSTGGDSDSYRSRLRKRRKLANKEKGGGKRKTSSLLMTLKANQKTKTKRMKSLREYFGEDENVYIMDARTSGNIGRYLNHSCTPNVFVQNVFVDTHDPRFPWVSFFALKFIEAGSELTWDYAYDIGSVPDKVVYCYCGTTDCRGRLL